MTQPNYWIKGQITGEGDCTPASILNAFRHFGMDADLDDIKKACGWELGQGATPQTAYQWLWENGMEAINAAHYFEWPAPPWPGSDRATLLNAAYMLQVYRHRFNWGYIAIVSERWEGSYHSCLAVAYENDCLRRVCHISGVSDLRPEEWYWGSSDRYLLPAPLMWLRPLQR